MKTMTMTIAALLLTGCTAAAEDATPKTAGPGWGPGWRHEQMAQAWEKGEMPGPMMMMRGMGPGARGPAIGADGKIDTSQLPPWCPLNKAAEPK